MSEEMLPCACCDALTIDLRGAYEICEICRWEDDPVQFADPDYAGGANKESLNAARTKWKNSI